MQKEWLFNPLDVLFFRDGTPFNMGETIWLESIFPPTPQTMQGVVRSAIVTSHCTQYDETFVCETCSRGGDYSVRGKCKVPSNIGSWKEGDYGRINLYGPYLVKDVGNLKKRYHPVPLDLACGKDGKVVRLQPDQNETHCDLGKIRLPMGPANVEAIKTLEGWIEEADLVSYLNNRDCAPAENDIRKDSDFFIQEPRVGLARDHEKHSAREGMLYSIAPLRFKDNVRLAVAVNGLEDDMSPKGIAIRVGGEGRTCSVKVENHPSCEITKVKFNESDTQIKLLLLQAADFEGCWYPAGFKQTNGCIEGMIDSVKLRLVSACTGRPQRVGGWDMAKHRNKAIKSYVPAGSVYFLEVMDGNDPSKLKNSGKIGENTQIGFGQYLLGRW